MPSPSHPVKRAEWRRAVIKSDLSFKAKLALICLLEYVNEDCQAWPSLTTLGQNMSCGKDSARRGLAEAAAAGWIEVGDRYHSNVGQTSNCYTLVGLDPHGSQLPPHSPQQRGHGSQQRPPLPTATPPMADSNTNKTREQDQRTSSKQISPVIREVWADLAGAAAVPDALGDYTLGQQESAALEAAGAVKAGRAHNPVGLLLSLVRNLAGDAPRVSAEAIRAALVPEPVAAEPMRPEWQPMRRKEYVPMTPEEKAEAKAALKAFGEMLGVTA